MGIICHKSILLSTVYAKTKSGSHSAKFLPAESMCMQSLSDIKNQSVRHFYVGIWGCFLLPILLMTTDISDLIFGFIHLMLNIYLRDRCREKFFRTVIEHKKKGQSKKTPCDSQISKPPYFNPVQYCSYCKLISCERNKSMISVQNTLVI